MLRGVAKGVDEIGEGFEVFSRRWSNGGAKLPIGSKTIPWIVPNSLPKEEEAAVLKTLSHIDSGTKPIGKIGKKWGVPFSNREGYLPPGKYIEYTVAPPPGTTNRGVRRIVQNVQTGELHYTWTHYGTTGKPTFLRIR